MHITQGCDVTTIEQATGFNQSGVVGRQFIVLLLLLSSYSHDENVEHFARKETESKNRILLIYISKTGSRNYA